MPTIPRVPLLLRGLICLAPAEYRARLGDELLAFLGERFADSTRTREPRARVWLRVTVDLATAIVLEWLRVLVQHRSVGAVPSVHERSLSAEDQMSVIGQEVIHAARSLRKNVGFTAAAVLTLALGLGSTTAIFSVVYSVLLQPLPFPESDRIIIPEASRIASADRWSITYADYMDWRDNHVFAYVAPYRESDMDLTGSGEPVRVKTAVVGPQFFGAIGTRASHGRLLAPIDYGADAARAVVISDRLWRTQFGGRSDIVGSVVDINGLKRPIVGVMPPNSRWPLDADVWVPLRITSEQDPDLQRRDNFIFDGIARLAPGATMASTRAAMAGLAARVAAAHPSIRKDVTMVPTPVLQWMLGDRTPRALWILLAAVALLLLIGCVNVANLQLARATSRQRELAVRTALGASKLRLVRQTLVESMLLGLSGGVLGVLFAYWMVRVLVAAAPSDVPRIATASVHLPVLAFAFVVSLVVALLFGLMPAMQSWRSDPHLAIGEGGSRASSGRSSGRARRTLVVVELALSVLLLIGAGLAIRSIQHLRNVQVGFDARSVLTASISIPGSRYQTSGDVVRLLYTLRDRLAAAPGIRAAAIVSASPIGGGGFYLGRMMAMEGKAPTPENEVSVNWNVTTPGYFGALNVPVHGRDFTARDDTASTPVMIVNEAFAHAMFGKQNPIGHRAMSTRDEKVYREIVGVVPNFKYYGVRDSVRALVWVPYAQRNAWPMGIITVRTDGPPAAATSILRRELGSVDPNIALANVMTMDQAAARSMAGDRMLAVLLTAFAVLALALAAVGIFGVLSYSVAQRTHELGVRIAIGAQRRDVLLLVLRETMPLVIGGVAIGLGAGLGLTRVMRAMLFEVQPTDPATFATVAVLLTIVGMAASLVPARRAAMIDPVIALRRD